MIKKIYKFECWNTHQSKSIDHLTQYKDLEYNASKCFGNFRNLPYNPNLNWLSSANNWQLYINHCDVYLPQPYWNWDNFSRNFWRGDPNGFKPTATTDGEKFSDFAVGCKKMGVTPIYCWGTSEEPVPNVDWLGRAPTSDKWRWIRRFMKEFCIYINKKYGFKECVIEIFNESIKTGNYYDATWYKQIAAYMAEGVKSANLGYEVWFNSNDLQHIDYVKQLIKYEPLIKNCDRITTHCNSYKEWEYREDGTNASYVQIVNRLIHESKTCMKYGMVNQVVSELSPVSGLYPIAGKTREETQLIHFKERMYSLKGKTSGYGILFFPCINDIYHTGDYDDDGAYILYDRILNGEMRKSGYMLGRNQKKHDIIKELNRSWK